MCEHDQECGHANSVVRGTSRLGQIIIKLLNWIVPMQIPGSSRDDSKQSAANFQFLVDQLAQKPPGEVPLCRRAAGYRW
jgi:hypothetical protein